MNKQFFTTALVAALLFIPATMTLAQQKKQPLTLKRIGHNIGHETTRLYKNTEYGVRKGGENASVTAHRTIGNNSRVRNRGKKKTDLVKPDGTHITKKVG